MTEKGSSCYSPINNYYLATANILVLFLAQKFSFHVQINYTTHSPDHNIRKTMIDRFHPGEGAHHKFKNGHGQSDIALPFIYSIKINIYFITEC